MTEDKNLLQVSSTRPRSIKTNVYRWLVSIVLIFVSVSVTQVSSEKVAQATYDPSALVLILDTSKGSRTVQLPITSVTSAITIDWGDGSRESSSASWRAHTYGSDRPYTVVVTGGAFSRFGGVTSNQSVFTAVEQWGTTYQPTSMQSAFDGWVNLTSVPTTIPSSVTNMLAMFQGASTFDGSIGSWNTANVTDMYAMFKNASTFNSAIGSWNTSKVTRMRDMFYGASAFNQPVNTTTNAGVTYWDTSKVTNMSNMFYDARAFNQPVNSWDTSKVVTISHMFRGASAFNQPVNSWDTSSMSDLSNAFQGATAFNQPVNLWKTSNVTRMNHMFGGASAFNQPVNTTTNAGVTYWDTSKVTNMSSMFASALAFNQPVDLWDTSKVTNMSNMFHGASVFNQPVDSWVTSAVTNMTYMFYGASAFNQPVNTTTNAGVTYWDTSNVENMSFMFHGASVFNQPVNSWDTSKVTSMSHTFYSASAFNQPINSWRVPNVTTMQSMFTGVSTFDTGNYDLFLILLSSQILKQPGRLDAAAKYSSAASVARANIVATYGWTINDRGLDQNYSSTPTYVVSFNGNGSTGGSPPPNQTKTHGVDLALASNSGSLVKTGYTFDGWNTAADGSGTSYAVGASYGLDAAETLYAKWTANPLTVTYNSQSGSAVSAGSTTSGGEIASAPVAPTRTGYVFTGWFTASTGGSAITFPYTHGQTASFTLHAQWSQASLHGISSVSKIGTITTTANVGNTFAVDTESSSVSLRYPANGLPADTVIDVYLVNDLSRARSLVAPAGGFVVSLVVAWLAADGSVPLMASGKPLSMTIANDTIKAGAKTYAIVGGDVTLLGTASVNGSVTISITEDPEIVIVNPVVVSQPSSSQPSSSQPSSSQPSSSQPSSSQPSASQPSSIARRSPVKVVELLPQIPGATSKIAGILNTVGGKLPPKPTVFAPKVLSNGQIARIAFTPIQIKAPPANAPVAPLGAKVFPIGAKIEQSQVTPTAPVSKVAAGESKATFGGKTIETEMSKAANGPAILSAGPATIALAGFADEPAASSSNSGGSTGLTASSSTPLEIATGSFIASTPVQVWLFSTPLLLAETAVDENGNFAAAISLPSSIPAGNHTLQIQGFVYAAGGAAEVTANIGVSIAAAAVGTRWSGTFPMYVASITPSVKSKWTKFVSAQNSKTLNCTITPVKPERNSKVNIRLYENRLISMTTMLKYNGCASVETLAPSAAKNSSVANRTWAVEVQSKASTVAFRWVHDFATYASTIKPAQKATWTALSTDFVGQKLQCVITGSQPIRNSTANSRIFERRNENLKAYLLNNDCSEVVVSKAISAKTKLASRTKWRVDVSVIK